MKRLTVVLLALLTYSAVADDGDHQRFNRCGVATYDEQVYLRCANDPENEYSTSFALRYAVHEEMRYMVGLRLWKFKDTPHHSAPTIEVRYLFDPDGIVQVLKEAKQTFNWNNDMATKFLSESEWDSLMDQLSGAEYMGINLLFDIVEDMDVVMLFGIDQALAEFKQRVAKLNSIYR
ncbi:MAG: hypothetical protein OXC80_12625 [Gammaproteobacteria bacterium]|nr:hypothetical protein [Gammaproteobacteria bacterium]